MNSVLFTLVFWVAAFERSVKTFAQTVIALVGVDQLGVLSTDWGQVLAAAGIAALLSVGTSIVSAGSVVQTPQPEDKVVFPDAYNSGVIGTAEAEVIPNDVVTPTE